MKNQIAFITGGSRGLGKDMVLQLAQQGVNIIFTFHSNKQAANEVIEEAQQSGVWAQAIAFDANKPMNSQELINDVLAIAEQHSGSKKIDFLINNAGTGTFNHVVDTTEEQFTEMMNVHLKSVYFITQKLLPHINDGGRIINISSGLTRFSFPGMSAYAMMKGAVEVFTRYLAKEFGGRKITANVVAPGAIATDFAGGSNKQEDKAAIISSITALGRVGEAEDIGGVISFLCSEKAGWINGQRLEVSGGMLV